MQIKNIDYHDIVYLKPKQMYAHSNYSELNYTISYWRTASQIEVDFILGDHKVAI